MSSPFDRSTQDSHGVRSFCGSLVDQRTSGLASPRVPTFVALSIKQPWATMLVHGLKSIEIRTWCRKFSGPLLIHAGRKLDTRMDVWQKLPRELWDEAKENTGGIVGRVIVTGWKTYRTAADFRADVPLHLNDPGWWMPPGPLFGLVCTEPEPLDFRAVRGMLGFFQA